MYFDLLILVENHNIAISEDGGHDEAIVKWVCQYSEWQPPDGMEGWEEKECWSGGKPVNALAPTNDYKRPLVTVVWVDVTQWDIGQLKGKVLIAPGQIATCTQRL